MHTSSTSTAPQVAFIREAECIGCTKCLNACPVDAIVGATRCLHTVIATDCTGCALCVTPCPMDCIELRPVDQVSDPNRAHSNTMRKQQRLSSLQTDTDTKPHQPIASATLPSTADEDEHKKLRLAVQKTRMALGKAEQQFKRRQTPLLEEQIQRLRIALQQAEERLEQAQNASEYDCSQTAESKDALHQAKLNLVAQRTALKQAERDNLSADERAKLQEQVTSAEQALHEAEAQTLRPAPQHIRTVLNPLPEAVRDLKTALALARAALSREGRRSPPDPERLAQATAKVQVLEQQLAHASDSNSTLPST